MTTALPAKPAARRTGAPAPPAGPASFKELLHQFGADRGRAIAAIRAGFPASLLKDTGVYFDVPAQRIRAIVRLPETTAHTLTKRGALMDPAASERLWRLADLMHLASAVFDDADAAKAWLRTPNLTFNDAAPMDYLDTEPGAMAVRQVLNAIATGGAL
ncbi:MAG: antitoxin Xre/MbcA/ParS toxin-binding domain-containing protein [Duganella sp.]